MRLYHKHYSLSNQPKRRHLTDCFVIGNHNWGNYGYLLDSDNTQSSGSKKPCDTKERTGKCETSSLLLAKVLGEKDTDFFASIISFFKNLLHF